jgi:GTP-binding protein
VLVFLVECTSADPKHDYQVLLNELALFKKDLVRRKKVVALTKTDTADAALLKRLKKISFGRGVPVVPISAVSRDGLATLLDHMWKFLQKKS